MLTKSEFNINTNFTDDIKGYWDGFVIGAPQVWRASNDNDPDSKSKILKQYHQFLWSKKLPNGDVFNLQSDSRKYLFYNNISLASDSIITSWNYKKGGCRDFIYELKKLGDTELLNGNNCDNWIQKYIRISYTSGGMMIFPKHPNSINGRRGCIREIKDRFDLTLICIKKFYDNPNDPTGYPQDFYSVLQSDSEFFELFVDFKGFVDFFYLNDWCDSEYNVNLLFGKGDFSVDDALPKTVEDFVAAVNKQISIVKLRNNRIVKALDIDYK